MLKVDSYGHTSNSSSSNINRSSNISGCSVDNGDNDNDAKRSSSTGDDNGGSTSNKLSNADYIAYKKSKKRDVYEEEKDPTQCCRLLLLFIAISTIATHL